MSKLAPSETGPMSLDQSELTSALIDHIADSDFPCLGAKSALARDHLRIETAWSINSGWNDLKIHDALLEWSSLYTDEPETLRSLAVVFSEPLDLTEAAFEKAMWERLQSLADKDGWRGQDYDPQVSSDPDDPHFSLSFGNQAYFIVGMHPHASRKARRATYPTLIFNLHDQFEQLRSAQRYDRMREAILDRDKALNGSINPMLQRHGEASEARQYSGRAVGPEWQCPFSDPRE
jgi:hypothetical protein